MYLVTLGKTRYFVTGSSTPQVWAAMSACICRQSGSLTLGTVERTMNVNSVWTKCSQDPVNSPSGRAQKWQAQRRVTPESVRTGKLIYTLPSFQVLFSREKPAATAESCESSLLLLLLYRSGEGLPCPCHASLEHGHGMAVIARMLFCSWSSLLLAATPA